MKKIIILLISILMYLQTNGETVNGSNLEFVKVGTKWWYSNFETFVQGTKEGYRLLESIKDTTINDTLVKKISVTIYFTNGDIFVDKCFYTKENNRQFLYKSERDLKWNLLFDKSWKIGNKYSIFLKEFLGEDNLKEYSFNVSDTGFVEIDGFKVKFTKLIFDSSYSYLFNDITFYHDIGYKKYFILTPTYEAVDGFGPGPLRCFKQNNFEFKNLYDNLTCDSLVRVDILNTYQSNYLTHSKLRLYPNPTNNDYIQIEDSNSENPTTCNIYSIEGSLICKKEIVNKSINLNDIKGGIYSIEILSHFTTNNILKLIKL